jgi:membrane fusion protein
VTAPDPSPGEPPRSALFRSEAVAEQQDRWLGTVLLTPKLSHVFYTAAASVLVLGLIALFSFGEYTQKARLSGWLAPERGLIQVVASQAGVLTQVLVEEGAEVEAGAPLAVLSAERQSGALGATQSEVVRALRARRDSLLTERVRHQSLFAEQSAAQETRLSVMADEVRFLEQEFELMRARLALAEETAARQRDLRERELATDAAVGGAEQERLDQALALQTLERQRTTLTRARFEIETAQAEAPLREALQLAEIDRAIAALEQEIAEAEAQREIVISAPSAGVVTALRASVGSSLNPAEALMTLVPADAPLEARLYGPSRSIGFVRPGQRVLLRYEAYPYQKFGVYEGVVKSVSRATVGATEFAVQAATTDVADLTTAGEPVYRVTVELTSQSAKAYGEPVPLQPGMTLEADVLIETLRIYEWVLDPLYSLTGRHPA